MPGAIATIPRLRLTDFQGDPLVGGSLTVYAAGTTDLENSWQDRSLSIFNTNPIILDGMGSCVVWLDDAKTYKVEVKNAAGATIWIADNIVGGGIDSSFELSAGLIQTALNDAQASAAAAAASAAAAAASLAAAQAIASGALVSEQQFTGPGPWLMVAPVVAVTGFRVNGVKWRLNKLLITGSPPLVVNISEQVISNESEIDIEHV